MSMPTDMTTRELRRRGPHCLAFRSFRRSGCPLSGRQIPARMRGTFALAALCVSGAACGRDLVQVLGPTDPYVVVHSVLDPTSRDQLVLVELGSNGAFTGRSSFGDRQQPVRGAVV